MWRVEDDILDAQALLGRRSVQCACLFAARRSMRSFNTMALSSVAPWTGERSLPIACPALLSLELSTRWDAPVQNRDSSTAQFQFPNCLGTGRCARLFDRVDVRPYKFLYRADTLVVHSFIFFARSQDGQI